jgi:hypothetical protein
MQSVLITTNVCEFESCSWRGVLDATLYDIKFVNDLRQFGGFIRVLRFSPPIKLTTTIQLKYFDISECVLLVIAKLWYLPTYLCVFVCTLRKLIYLYCYRWTDESITKRP